MIADAVVLVAELVALFFAVSFGVELAQRRVGPDRLKTWMGGRPAVAALKGIAVGFVTPFCTYSAIPMLVGLRRAGVPTAGFVAFIVAAPILDPVLFGALVLIVGPVVAASYVLVAFSAAMALALIASRIGIDRHLKPVTAIIAPTCPAAEPVPSGATAAVVAAGGCDPAPVTAEEAASVPAGGTDTVLVATAEVEPWRGLSVEWRSAAAGSVRLLRSMGPLLLVGVAIGLLIDVFVPPETVAGIAGDGELLSIPAAAAIGVPFYVNTELFVPIAESLTGAGVGPGTIVALTIAGAGANLPELVILTRLARARLVAALFAFIFAVAVAGGMLAQAVG